MINEVPPLGRFGVTSGKEPFFQNLRELLEEWKRCSGRYVPGRGLVLGDLVKSPEQHLYSLYPELLRDKPQQFAEQAASNVRTCLKWYREMLRREETSKQAFPDQIKFRQWRKVVLGVHIGFEMRNLDTAIQGFSKSQENMSGQVDLSKLNQLAKEARQFCEAELQKIDSELAKLRTDSRYRPEMDDYSE